MAGWVETSTGAERLEASAVKGQRKASVWKRLLPALAISNRVSSPLAIAFCLFVEYSTADIIFNPVKSIKTKVAVMPACSKLSQSLQSFRGMLVRRSRDKNSNPRCFSPSTGHTNRQHLSYQEMRESHIATE